MQERTPSRGVLGRCKGFCELLCKIWIVIANKRKTGDPCVYFPERVINRPDPCIYDQFLLMQLGQPVTWDNPDVSIFLAGVKQNTYDLLVNTTYDVAITVHNSSREKAAPGTKVEVNWLEFGAGGQIKHPIATTSADVPVWPGTVVAQVAWTTPPTPGHFCIEILLSHPQDGNLANNRGQNNTQVKAAASQLRTPIRVFNFWPAGCPRAPQGGVSASLPRVFLVWGVLIAGLTFTFGKPLFRESLPRLMLFVLAAYLAGVLIALLAEMLVAKIRNQRHGVDVAAEREHDCRTVEITVDSYRFNDGVGKAVDPAIMFAPRPPAWPASVEPSLFQFAPNELYRDVTLVVDAPDQKGLAEVFNVNVRQAGTPSGGVTVTVKTG
jgi:hypothetical protein